MRSTADHPIFIKNESWKRRSMEAVVWAAGKLTRTNHTMPPSPKSVFVLRNGDIGDLLVITPLFEALRNLYPDSRIIAGVGEWNLPTLELNPYITGTLALNAPWHNKFVKRQGLIEALRYILFSPEAERLLAEQFDVGIDILGSPFGSLLMLRGQVPYRLGVRGYAGGYSAVQSVVEYDQNEHVGRSALRFAELLGAKELPPVRPQIYLSNSELEKGRSCWNIEASTEPAGRTTRIVLGPGGGYQDKCWPLENFLSLARELDNAADVQMIVVGGEMDIAAGESLRATSTRTANLAGQTSLRDTFSIVASSDMVISNTSMLMHVAAAFGKPALVLLGNAIDSTEQHAAQWGYDGVFYMMGRNKLHPSISSPREALEQCIRILEQITPGCIRQ